MLENFSFMSIFNSNDYKRGYENGYTAGFE